MGQAPEPQRATCQSPLIRDYDGSIWEGAWERRGFWDEGYACHSDGRKRPLSEVRLCLFWPFLTIELCDEVWRYAVIVTRSIRRSMPDLKLLVHMKLEARMTWRSCTANSLAGSSPPHNAVARSKSVWSFRDLIKGPLLRHLWQSVSVVRPIAWEAGITSVILAHGREVHKWRFGIWRSLLRIRTVRTHWPRRSSPFLF